MLAKWLGIEDQASCAYVNGGLLLIITALLVVLVCNWMNGFDGFNVTGYQCDPRIGCNTRALSQRSVTDILLNRSRQIETAHADQAAKEKFDLSLFQPGVDRPYISQLQIDNKIRTEDLMEGLTGRAPYNSNYVQVGADGTVINPASNPLYRIDKHVLGVM